MTVTLYVNGQRTETPGGSSVLDAVNGSGTYISQLCKDADMGAIGACRTCLVQIDGQRGFPASCSVPAADGMKVWTDTPEVMDIRKGVVELTLGMLPGSNGNGANGYRELSTAAAHHEISSPRWDGRDREPVDTSNPVFDIAMDSCILCGRCAKGCQDGAQFIGAIDVLGTGDAARIGTFMDRPLVESICTTCGQCLSVCPTGAIRVKQALPQATKSVTTTCPYCGVGCGIKAQVDDTDRIIEMLDDPDNQSSLGMLCVKGRFGYTFVHHEDRLTEPLVRREGVLVPVSWDEALDYVAERLIEYRGDSFATLCSAKATNEDGYIQQKLARLLMQSNHIDHCTRPLPLAVRGGDADLARQWSDEQLLRRLRGGRMPGDYRLRRQLEPPRSGVAYEAGGDREGRETDCNQSAPHRHVRLRRPVAASATWYRRCPAQRHGQGDSR